MMALNFVNHNQNTIWIALVYGDAGCGPNQFRKQGWWSIPPGQTLNIWDVDLQTVNRHAAFYADDSSGNTWSGTGNAYQVTNAGFNQCFDDNTNCNQQYNFVPLDFDRADNGNHNFNDLTVTLGPTPGQIATEGSVRID